MIEAWVDGRSYSKGTAVSVYLRCGKFYLRRSIPITKLATSNQAELKAIELALTSVTPKNRDGISIKIGGRYGSMMFEKNVDGSWSRNANRNAELVDSIRENAMCFKEFKVEFVQDDPVIKELKELTSKVANSGEPYIKSNQD